MADRRKRRSYRSRKYKKNRQKTGRIISLILSFAAVIIILLISNGVIRFNSGTYVGSSHTENAEPLSFSSVDDVSAVNYNGASYAYINNNTPVFTDKEKSKGSFETYGNLDPLGRCTYAFANVYTDLLPTGERESIASVKPTGWHQNKYDFVDQGSLYNRCHLIAYSLTGENANEKNLVTGTRYMNTDGMGSFEKEVLDAVREKKLHVLYRVTPVFKGNNLLCDGVHMEAYSVEDKGKTVSFNVFVYNVQPGVAIDYASGNNKAA